MLHQHKRTSRKMANSPQEFSAHTGLRVTKIFCLNHAGIFEARNAGQRAIIIGDQGMRLSAHSILSDLDQKNLDPEDRLLVIEELQVSQDVALQKEGDTIDSTDTRDVLTNYSNKIFSITACSLVSTLAIILLEGFSFNGFNLPDQVLLAILVVMGNILGPILVVAKYFFSEKRIQTPSRPARKKPTV